MIISRRGLLLVTGGALLSHTAMAHVRELGEFTWRYPGRDPLRGISDAEALRRLSSGNLIPPGVQTELLRKITRNEYVEDEIPLLDRGYFFTRMLFGRGIIAPNVVALTAEWPVSATRQVRRYEYQGADGLVYVLVRPYVCGNWALRIITIQNECVVDLALCSASCSELRKHQQR